jgi:hypothetical protein
MVLVLEDDGCLHLYDSPAAVCVAIEGLDAEDTLRAVFDERGQRYAIEWARPNRTGWLGLENGAYRLVPAGAPDVSGLLELLSNTPVFPAHLQEVVDRIRVSLIAGD